MLTADRPDFAMCAVSAFLKQTYQPRALMILDTGKESILDGVALLVKMRGSTLQGKSIDYYGLQADVMAPIGWLRNYANQRAAELFKPDILIHWDDDDWSHPNRIAEQVNLLAVSGADAVGYNELLFSRTQCITLEGAISEMHSVESEAWIYTNRAAGNVAGTSLCYWLSTWKNHPFRGDRPSNAEASSEYQHWKHEIEINAVSAVPDVGDLDDYPTMIARIHGTNSMSYDIKDLIARGSTNWKRAPQWDERVREYLK
jgi:hypothetical protein